MARMRRNEVYVSENFDPQSELRMTAQVSLGYLVTTSMVLTSLRSIKILTLMGRLVHLVDSVTLT